MKVGIFETTHFEGAYPIIKLFDNGQNDIVIFCYAQSYRQFQFLFKNEINKYDWVIKKDEESTFHFINTIFKEARKRKLDILYLNTVTDNHSIYALYISLLKNTRVILTLHDINNYFESAPGIHFKKIIRSIGKKWLINKVKEFNVVSLTMVDYLKSKLPSSKKVHCLPGAIFEEENLIRNSIKPGQPLNIVVPGSIDSRRRNYATVFELLDKINHRGLPVNITLLGGPYGDYGMKIIEQCKLYSMNHRNLQFYEMDIVDQPEFDKVMNDAHFVFIPSVIDTIISDGVPETYGVSISSGNQFDIIKHSRPFIAPVELKIDPYLESTCIRYTLPDDIFAAIKLCLASPMKYDEMQETAISASSNYTVEKLRDRNPDIFMSFELWA